MSFFLNHLTESNSSDHWDISGFDIGSLDKPVTRIYLVAHENEFNQGSSSRPVLVNNWSIYLATSRKRSVQIEFIGNRVLKGVVRLVDRDDMCFLRRNAFVLAISLVKDRRRMESIHLDVQDILTIIIRHGRDRYIQNDDSGAAVATDDSRFWIYTVVSDFVKEGIVEEKDKARVRKVISRYWPFPKGSRSVPCPFVTTKGAFVDGILGSSL